MDISVNLRKVPGTLYFNWLDTQCWLKLSGYSSFTHSKKPNKDIMGSNKGFGRLAIE